MIAKNTREHAPHLLRRTEPLARTDLPPGRRATACPAAAKWPFWHPIGTRDLSTAPPSAHARGIDLSVPEQCKHMAEGPLSGFGARTVASALAVGECRWRSACCSTIMCSYRWGGGFRPAHQCGRVGLRPGRLARPKSARDLEALEA